MKYTSRVHWIVESLALFLKVVDKAIFTSILSERKTWDHMRDEVTHHLPSIKVNLLVNSKFVRNAHSPLSL